MHDKRAVTYIRLQQCTCCNHHDHHRHHKQKRDSKCAKHAVKHEVQVHTQMQLIRSHTRSSKHAQQLKHFKNANQKLEYAEHPSLSHRENKLQYKIFNSTTHASNAQCPKKPSINQTCKSASPSTAGHQTTVENEDKQSPIRQTRSTSPCSNPPHSQPHQIINHVSNTYSCKSQIHERREVSSSMLNNMAQHRHRMPNTDKNIRAAAATIPRIKLKNPSSKPTITQQPNGKKQYHHCTRFANNTVIVPFVSLS